MTDVHNEAADLHVTGVVQGVGFRPFVFNLARAMGLTGWVLNSSEGVFVHVEGAAEAVTAFPRRLETEAPPMAVIVSVTINQADPEGFEDFAIRASQVIKGAATLISPDIATCPACLAELANPHDRRGGYPFINCTNCGPRFTIIDDIPYDRPNTTMRTFPMCPQCAAEYGDPADRRFHAQPDACFVCGPRLYLDVLGPGRELPLATSDCDGGDFSDWVWSADCDVDPRPHREREPERLRSAAIVAHAGRLLEAHAVLAVKGLGGFHLVCDATDEVAVAALRERKRRWGKPLAVMVRDVEEARRFAEVGPLEEELLAGAVRPIVLLRLRADRPLLAAHVAPGLAEIGVMLPYTPLHHLLLEQVGRPLVMTSGNLSDEPIAIDNAEALRRLAPIADAFLLHDRPIGSRYDDSVVRVVAGKVEPVRRSRGYAPFPVTLPFRSEIAVLATGPEQKNTFTLIKGSDAFVSQHIGDMENAETLEHYEATLALYERLFRIEPELVAYDLHPEYLSTKFALALPLPRFGVQHHHAHIAGVAAEHGVSAPVVGLAFDGTGYGTDGTIWGGEILVADWTAFERVGHLRAVPMPGGAAAVRRPARMAYGLLAGLDPALLDHPGAYTLLSALSAEELTTLPTMVERRINSPMTSSMGRLFDAVAALAGVRFDALYEGQAAIELEATADRAASGEYAFGLHEVDGLVTIDPLPMVEALLDDLAAGVDRSTVSMRFHRAVVAASVRTAVSVARERGIGTVAASGGVLMNRIVMAGIAEAVRGADLAFITHEKLPVNDGSISFGQAVVGWANRDRAEQPPATPDRPKAS
jgi:hydrogenase maturation protein HypF